MIPQVPPPEPNNVLLEAVGITKSFPGVRALEGVNVTVRRGRLNALIGENGAGKSTLMNILAGVFPPDAGTVTLEGRPVSFKNTREAQAAGISIIFQELNLVPELSIAENIFIGREPLNRFRLVDFPRMNARRGSVAQGTGTRRRPANPCVAAQGRARSRWLKSPGPFRSTRASSSWTNRPRPSRITRLRCCSGKSAA